MSWTLGWAQAFLEIQVASELNNSLLDRATKLIDDELVHFFEG